MPSERDLFRFMDSQHKPLADSIAGSKKLDEDTEKQVRAMLDEFKKTNSYADAPAEKPAKAEKPAPDQKPAKQDAPAKQEAKA